jgi:hypothetical protein
MVEKEMSALVGISHHSIYYWTDKGGLHRFKNADGRTLICKPNRLVSSSSH